MLSLTKRQALILLGVVLLVLLAGYCSNSTTPIRECSVGTTSIVIER